MTEISPAVRPCKWELLTEERWNYEQPFDSSQGGEPAEPEAAEAAEPLRPLRPLVVP